MVHATCLVVTSGMSGDKPATHAKGRQARHDSQPASQRVFVFASAKSDEQLALDHRLCHQ